MLGGYMSDFVSFMEQRPSLQMREIIDEYVTEFGIPDDFHPLTAFSEEHRVYLYKIFVIGSHAYRIMPVRLANLGQTIEELGNEILELIRSR